MARSAARLRGGSLVTVEIALGLVLTVLAGLTCARSPRCAQWISASMRIAW
jgi:hypothetical protein